MTKKFLRLVAIVSAMGAVTPLAQQGGRRRRRGR
jgi:hypothetical protein